MPEKHSLVKQQCGASMVEYAIGLVLLVGLLLFAGGMLSQSAGKRAEVSQHSESQMVPCFAGGAISGADACK